MKKRNLLLFIPVISTAMFLSGCASDSKQFVDLNLRYVPTSSVPATSDPNAQAQIADTATSVNQSLQQLSAIQQATNPGVRMGHPMDPHSIGMAQQVSLNWTGPIEPVLKKIARASNYQLRVLGNRPAIPVIVIVHTRNATLASILRNVTYQATGKANINIYPHAKIIELRYRAN